MDWPFTSTKTSHIPLVDLTKPPKFDDYFDVIEQIKVTIETFLDFVTK